MFSISKKVLCSAFVVLIMVSLFAACQTQPDQGNPVLGVSSGGKPDQTTSAPEVSSGQKSDQATSTLEVTSGREPNVWVSGSVTYRERITLSPEAKLEVAIYGDGPSSFVARQTISNPGQVPIEYRVGYNRDDLDPMYRYSVTVSIYEGDGRLAFVNDRFPLATEEGYSSEEALVLVLVNPPPEMIGDMEDWKTEVEVPARVISAELMSYGVDHYLKIDHFKSRVDGCPRPGSPFVSLKGDEIVAAINVLQPPPAPWSVPCDEKVRHVYAIERIQDTLDPDRTYFVVVNDQAVTSLTIPDPELGDTSIADSPIESAEVRLRLGDPTEYNLHVVSGMPKGSGCSQFNGYQIRQRWPKTVEVAITHHEVADPSVMCTTDYPVVETIVPLVSDFEPGREYTVVVNSDTVIEFEAQ